MIKKCLDGGNCQQECDNYILRSVNLEIYLHKIKRATLSVFDDKRNFINNTENLPGNYYH